MACDPNCETDGDCAQCRPSEPAIRLSERRAVLLRVAGELAAEANAHDVAGRKNTARAIVDLAAKYRREAEEKRIRADERVEVERNIEGDTSCRSK